MAIHTPPWALSGRGLLALCRADAAFVPPGRRENFRGGLSAVMLIDYAASPVGPYRELLFVGGFFEEAGRVRPSVTRILVDSEESAASGRENWGLPKEVARFDWKDKFVRVTQGDRLLAEFGWRAFGPEFPATTAPLPRPWRTLAQPWNGRVLFTAPEASGKVRPARLAHVLINPDLFPDVGAASPLLALEVTRFEMTFPVPGVRPQKSGLSGR